MPRKRAKNEDIDISSLRVVDLKKELSLRGLDTTGKKANLVARLEKAIQDSPSRKKTKVEAPKTCPSTSSTASASTSAVSCVDYSKVSVADLIKELKCKGLSTTGKKQDLIRRLEMTTEELLSNEEKEEEAVEEVDLRKAKEMLAIKIENSTKESVEIERKSDHIDPYWEVLEDWDCVLIQTNISKNANNFYIIQLLHHDLNAVLWTRWGRVGEPRMSNMSNSAYLNNVKEAFKKKFLDKTGNNWENKVNFVPVPGKFTMVEIDDGLEEDEHQTSVKLAAMEKTGTVPALTSLPCMLDEPTKHWIKLLIKRNEMADSLQSLDIDTKRMPLGKVSKAQVMKGFEALEAIENALKMSKSQTILEELASNFYSIIPHDFGRKAPPIISDKDTLQKKIILLLVLGGIETVPGRRREEDNASNVPGIPHKLDLVYKSLNCDLTLMDPSSHEYQVISKYTVSTNMCTPHMIATVLNIWRVNQHNEKDRFKEHDIQNHRLLWWQGCSLQSLLAVLKLGQKAGVNGPFRPGIYHSSSHNLSIHSAICETSVGLMILSQVALGKEFRATQSGLNLPAPPDGFDSVVVVGRREPDPKDDTILKIDGKDVIVSHGKLIATKFTESLSHQTDYVVYKESQTKIRYMLMVKFDRS